jgi:hypothetical protein
MAVEQVFRARKGDEVVVGGHRIGEARRVGAILEVLGEPGHERWRVRWQDGRESVFAPGSDAVVSPKAKTAKAKA